MKTKIGFISGMLTIAMALVMTTGTVYADGGITDIYAKGETSTPAGDYVVRSTNDIYYYQGVEYEVFKVYYDDPSMNMNIAVNTDEQCKSFIAYSKDYTIFYDCTRDGFGARKIMFSNPDTQDKFDCVQYQKQTVLRKEGKIETKEAVTTIAASLPVMKTS